MSEKKATKISIEVLDEEENRVKIDKIIKQLELATKNVKSNADVGCITQVHSYKDYTYVDGASTPFEITRTYYKIKGVDTGDDISITSIGSIFYNDTESNNNDGESVILNSEEIIISGPKYKYLDNIQTDVVYDLDINKPTPRYPGDELGCILSIKIPIKDNNKAIGHINIELNVINLDKIPKNVNLREYDIIT